MQDIYYKHILRVASMSGPVNASNKACPLPAFCDRGQAPVAILTNICYMKQQILLQHQAYRNLLHLRKLCHSRATQVHVSACVNTQGT